MLCVKISALHDVLMVQRVFFIGLPLSFIHLMKLLLFPTLFHFDHKSFSRVIGLIQCNGNLAKNRTRKLIIHVSGTIGVESHHGI